MFIGFLWICTSENQTRAREPTRDSILEIVRTHTGRIDVVEFDTSDAIAMLEYLHIIV